MIVGDNISFEYFRRDVDGEVVEVIPALDGVSLHIEPGSFVVILGGNGSGKSTLARHFNALLTSEEGTVIVDHIHTEDKETIFEVRKRAGMVFQNPENQMVSSIVQEDVAFGPENIGLAPKKIRERVKEVLGGVGLWTKRGASTNQLSGGEKQRVSIAGVLALKPKCIVLDEPTAMLDPQNRQMVMETLVKLNREEKITIVLITHYMEEAVLGDYIYLMNNGKIHSKGTPTEIFRDRKALEECKLDVPEIVRIAEGLRAGGVPVPGDVIKEQQLVDWLITYRGGARR